MKTITLPRPPRVISQADYQIAIRTLAALILEKIRKQQEKPCHTTNTQPPQAESL